MSGQDLFLVVHDKVYDATKFVDEHPYALPLSLLAIWRPLPLRELSRLPHLMLCVVMERLADEIEQRGRGSTS